MGDIELILNMIGAAVTTRLARDRNTKGYDTSRKDAQDGGAVAGSVRRNIEWRSWESVVSRKNILSCYLSKRS